MEAFTSHPRAISTDLNFDPGDGFWQPPEDTVFQKIVPPPLVETVRQRRLRETYLQGLRSPQPRPPALACQNTDFSERDAARWGKRAAERRKQTGSALDVTFSLLCLHRKSADILVDFFVSFGFGFRHKITLAFPVKAAGTLKRARLTCAVF